MVDTRLYDVIAGALDLAADAITAESTTKTVPAWDSLGHLRVILAVEAAYRVKFSTAEIRELVSVKRLHQELERRKAL